MSESLESQNLKDAIKLLLKRGGYRYEDLAAALGVSLPTVRRFLTKEDLSVERLAAICRWLGVSFKELAELAEQQAPEAFVLSEEQEAFFVTFPAVYAYLRSLGAGMTPAAIAQAHALTPASTARYLADLTALGLIERAPSGAVRLLIPWPAFWRYPGPLQAAYAKAIHHAAVDHLEQASADPARQPHYGKDYFFFLDLLRLQHPTYLEYVRELVALYRKYAAISRFEAKTQPPDALFRCAALLGIDRWDAFAEVLGGIGNFP